MTLKDKYKKNIHNFVNEQILLGQNRNEYDDNNDNNNINNYNVEYIVQIKLEKLVENSLNDKNQNLDGLNEFIILLNNINTNKNENINKIILLENKFDEITSIQNYKNLNEKYYYNKNLNYLICFIKNKYLIF